MMDGRTDDKGLSGLGDIMKGFGKLISNVVDMVEKDIPKKSTSGELFDTENKHGLKGTYGFSVKLGLDKKDMAGMKRETEIVVPQTDIFREEGRIIAVLEMIDVNLENFNYSLEGNILQIEGSGEKTVYRKKIDLGDFEADEKAISVSENNGIFKVVINGK